MRTFLCPLLLGVLCWAASCQSEKEQPAIPEEKMARIMADLNLAEAATNGLAGYPKDSLMYRYFSQTFDLHGTTVAEYEKSLRLYAQDTERMTRLVHRSEELLGAKE